MAVGVVECRQYRGAGCVYDFTGLRADILSYGLEKAVFDQNVGRGPVVKDIFDEHSHIDLSCFLVI